MCRTTARHSASSRTIRDSLSSPAIVLFLRYYPKLKQTTVWMHYGTLAMLAGAVGNLIDRVRLHYVVDFFDFRIWPVFNIADIAIVGGVISMIYAILFKMKDDEA